MTHGLVHACTISDRRAKRKITYTSGTGTPALSQEVIGATSKATAVIDRVSTGYIVIKSVVGTFANAETISSTTWSGTISSQEDYMNQSREIEYYWTAQSSTTPCRFYYKSIKPVMISESGILLSRIPMCMLDGSVTISESENRIASTVTGFVGIWNITSIATRCLCSTPHHFELALSEAR
jgi:hypothetical protein